MEPKPAYLSVSQTAWTIDATILFIDGKSEATTVVLEHGPRKRLLLFYDFVPRTPTQSDPRRRGAASLDITSSRLDGKYWNDARMWGFLVSEGRTRKTHDSYESAAEQGDYR